MAERYVSFIVLPVTVIICSFSWTDSRRVVRKQLRSGRRPFAHFGPALLPSVLNGVYISQLFAVNRPGLSAKLTLLNFGVNVGLMTLLIPDALAGVRLFGLGEDGAAISYLVSSSLMFVVARISLRRLTDSPFNKRIALHVIAAILTGGSVLVLSSRYAVNGPVSLIRILYIDHIHVRDYPIPSEGANDQGHPLLFGDHRSSGDEGLRVL